MKKILIYKFIKNTYIFLKLKKLLIILSDFQILVNDSPVNSFCVILVSIINWSSSRASLSSQRWRHFINKIKLNQNLRYLINDLWLYYANEYLRRQTGNILALLISERHRITVVDNLAEWLRRCPAKAMGSPAWVQIS